MVVSHISGRQPIAIYPVTEDRTQIAVLDFDNHDNAFTFEEMGARVLPVFNDLIAIGLKPLTFRSGGGEEFMSGWFGEASAPDGPAVSYENFNITSQLHEILVRWKSIQSRTM